MAFAEAVIWSRDPLGVLVDDDVGTVTLTAAFADEGTARRCAALLGGGATVAESAQVDWCRVHDGPVDVVVGAERLVLDVGPTFGWGGHPSTRLLLDWMAAHPPTGGRVLDVGTGSGVLAIAAARLGASVVEAIDVDPDAVAIAAANADANGVGATVRTSRTPLAAVAGPFGVVLANLAAPTIVELRHDLLRVSEGGVLAVSGLLVEREGAVAAALAPARVTGRWEAGGWVALVAARGGVTRCPS